MSKPASARLTESDQKMINELLESKNFAKTFTRMINGNCKLALKAQRVLDKDMDVAHQDGSRRFNSRSSSGCAVTR